eukprot:767548-Hanusia_phi.AAC.5
MAIENGRATRKDLKCGICGEHGLTSSLATLFILMLSLAGGEPSSIEFVSGAGMDYVSCSPFRVPIARLAAAQVPSFGPFPSFV